MSGRGLSRRSNFDLGEQDIDGRGQVRSRRSSICCVNSRAHRAGVETSEAALIEDGGGKLGVRIKAHTGLKIRESEVETLTERCPKKSRRVH